MDEWLSKIKPRSASETLPCIEGWRLNIAAVKMLWDDIKDESDFLLMNRLNQDCIENFFGQVRAKGICRDNPDVQVFESDYLQLAVDQLILPVKRGNCMPDFDPLVVNLISKKKPVQPPVEHVIDDADVNILPAPAADAQALTILPLMLKEVSLPERNILAYIAGFLVKKVLTHVKAVPCGDCRGMLKNAGECDRDLTLIQLKQYSHLDSNSGLQRPSAILVEAVQRMEEIFRQYIPVFISKSKIRGFMLEEACKSEEMKKLQCRNCSGLKLQHYVGNIFFTLRVHHCLKLQSQFLAKPGQKRNRKLLKLLHM